MMSVEIIGIVILVIIAHKESTPKLARHRGKREIHVLMHLTALMTKYAMEKSALIISLLQLENNVAYIRLYLGILNSQMDFHGRALLSFAMLEQALAQRHLDLKILVQLVL
jgi:hypothetical protein